MDDDFVLEFFRKNSKLPARKFIEAYLGTKAFFGEDMSRYRNLADMLTVYIENIDKNGMREAMKRI